MTRDAAAIGAGLAPARPARPIPAGQRLHVIGVAGAGASAAALLAHHAGALVTGCDAGGASPYTPPLEEAGVTLALAAQRRSHHDRARTGSGGGHQGPDRGPRRSSGAAGGDRGRHPPGVLAAGRRGRGRRAHARRRRGDPRQEHDRGLARPCARERRPGPGRVRRGVAARVRSRAACRPRLGRGRAPHSSSRPTSTPATSIRTDRMSRSSRAPSGTTPTSSPIRPRSSTPSPPGWGGCRTAARSSRMPAIPASKPCWTGSIRDRPLAVVAYALTEVDPARGGYLRGLADRFGVDGRPATPLMGRIIERGPRRHDARDPRPRLPDRPAWSPV